MKKKRSILFILVVFCMVLSVTLLSGCNASKKEEASSILPSSEMSSEAPSSETVSEAVAPASSSKTPSK